MDRLHTLKQLSACESPAPALSQTDRQTDRQTDTHTHTHILISSTDTLARDAMLARYMLSSCVCLSVCHKSVLSTRLNVGSCKLRRGTVYSFLTQHISATLQPMSSRATTASNANEMGYNRRPSTKSVRHLTNISLNVRNGARQRYSYYGRLIGNRMHAIK